MQQLLSPILRWLASQWGQVTLVILFCISALSLMPLPQLPDVPGSDKLHHIAAYGILMLPVALRAPRHWWLIGIAFIAWSGVIELIQPFVNRYGEWLDLAANTAGLLIGLLVGTLLRRLLS